MMNAAALQSVAADAATAPGRASNDTLPRFGRIFRIALGWATMCAALAGALWFLLWRVEALEIRVVNVMPQPGISQGRVSLSTPGYAVTADLASYDDELFAFLMFNHMRENQALRGMELLLTYDRRRRGHRYRLILRGPDDFRLALARLATVQLAGAAGPHGWRLESAAHIKELQRETDLFVSAYNLPVRRKLETLPHPALVNYLRSFIQFKSNTDPRVRLKLEPTPKPLSGDQAQGLAADILTIADFYSLPLEFLLGIGAMENNYMDVRGDLKHTIWKRKPAADDIVLERRRGRVRILNDSAGVWQITRETLRYAHSLYQKDGREYSRLPEHLRPPKELRINEVGPLVLTTYAGLLLRDLLDLFEGDVTLAVSAYNGGPARPNLRYGAGVHRAASHARRVLEQSAALKGEKVVNMTWMRAR